MSQRKIETAAMRKLGIFNPVVRIEELRIPPNNRLEASKPDRRGQWSIHINDQWRICFRFVDGRARDVEIGVPQMRISEIVAGKCAITVDTGLRLSRYFGLNDSFWTGLQLRHDVARAKDELAEELERITPPQSA